MRSPKLWGGRSPQGSLCSANLSPGTTCSLPFGGLQGNRTRPESEQKVLMDPTCGCTCLGPPVDPRLGRCPILSSFSPPSWPPKTDHRDGTGVCSVIPLDTRSTPSAGLNTPHCG